MNNEPVDEAVERQRVGEDQDQDQNQAYQDHYGSDRAVRTERAPMGGACPEKLSALADRVITDDFIRLLATATRLVATLDSKTLLASIAEHVVHTLPSAQASMLWLQERRASKLRLVSLSGFELDFSTAEMLRESSLSPTDLLGSHSHHDITLHYAETQSGYQEISPLIHTQNKHLIELLAERLPHTLRVLSIPLVFEQELVGVLQLFTPLPCPPIEYTGNDAGNYTGNYAGNNEGQDKPDQAMYEVLQPLSPQCEQLLRTFGGLIATTIKNAAEYGERVQQCRRLESFDAVVNAIGTATDLQDLMRSVLEVVLTMLPVSSGLIMLLDPTQEQLTLGSYQNIPEEYVEAVRSMPVAGAFCEEVVRYGQPSTRPLIEERGEEPLIASGLESCTYLPLLAGGTVVGVLGLYGTTLLHREINTASLIPLSNQVGFAIANVRLYEVSQIERRKLDTVINSIAEGVMLCNSKGQLALANEAAMTLLKLDAIPFHQPFEEMSTFYNIRNLEHEPLSVEQIPMAKALCGEVFHDYRVMLRGASGENSIMSFSGSPTYTDTGGTLEGAVVTFRDITAHQRLERAKDEFLAIAAHELRSPLASVRGYADMLLKRERERSESSDLRGLTILSQQVSHMLRMVDNLLDVSRLDAGRVDLQLQHVNLVNLITQVLDQQRPGAANRALLLETTFESLFVYCDQMRIRQVLTNLVGNAIKYSPQETSITVTLDTRERAQSEQQDEDPAVSFAEASQELLICVCNRGAPIPEEQRKMLFQRYFRGHGRRAEGLGLGLYLSQKFVLLHGGHIWVESDEERGNRFLFTLPMREPVAAE
jgi:two-component system phosphate regulon sensor histidine kinase PhoR